MKLKSIRRKKGRQGVALSLMLFIFSGITHLSAQQPATASSPVKVLTLGEALQLAKTNSVQFRAAQAEAALAHEDRVQARATLLPEIRYNNEFLYTEGNKTPAGRFIGNNAVHEYISQGNAHQVLSLEQFADFRKSGANAALAHARAEVGARGLVAVVVRNYYAVLAAQHKHNNVVTAEEEASRFLALSEKLEHGGEVAHSDVLRAQLQFNDKKRESGDSQLELLKSELDLAVLIMPAPTSNFALDDDLDTVPALPEIVAVRKAAAENNPDLRAALAATQAAQDEVSAAKAAHLPSVGFDYYYGIDATHFAVRTDGVRNLGYAAVATLNVPVFSWGATQSKVRQAQIRESQAKLELTVAQKQVLANIEQFYGEAQVASTALITLRESVAIASEGLRLIELRYQAGESTVLEVVDAQNTLNTARNTYVDGSLRYKMALANLQTLTGRF